MPEPVADTPESKVSTTGPAAEAKPKTASKRKTAAAPPKPTSPKTSAANVAPSNGAHSKKTAAPPTKEASTTAKAAVNPEPAAPTPPKEPPPAVARAEDTLDEWGKVVGGLFVSVGRKLTKAVVVAREEMEDLWAEAQSIRRGDTK